MMRFMQKYGKFLAAFALTIATLTVNSTCIWTTYQPEVPEKAKALRKF